MGLNASANPEPSSLHALTQNMGISLLDDELMSLGKHKTLIWLVSTKVDYLAVLFNKLKIKRQHESVCTAPLYLISIGLCVALLLAGWLKP